MNTRWRRLAAVSVIVGPWCAAAVGAEGAGAAPTTAPTSQPVVWGDSKAGLQAALTVRQPVRALGKFRIAIHLRNVGTAAVPLGAAKEAFGWLFLSYGKPRVFFTEKFAFGKAWPAQLASGQAVRFPPVALGGRKCYMFQPGLKMAGGYPRPADGLEALRPYGPASKALSFGKAGVRAFVYVPGTEKRPRLLVTNTVKLAVEPPDLKAVAPDRREAYVKDLMARFSRDAWSAQAASSEAVGVGREIVPELAVAAANRKAPRFAKMWLATTIAKIGDERGVPALVKFMDDPSGSVRHVVAYHGPRARSKRLDAMIIARAVSDESGLFTAWAVRGFWVCRRMVPEKLLALGLASKEPKARAAAAGALARDAGAGKLARLIALLADEHEMVRVTAARTMANANVRSKEAIGALIVALGPPGETARQGICQALATLTGQKIRYDPQADPQAKAKVIEAWRSYWRRHQDKFK